MYEFLKPPQAVLYTLEMEPITILDMKPGYWDFLIKNGNVRFAYLQPLRVEEYTNINQDEFTINWDYVEIHGSRIINHAMRYEFLLLNTSQETKALLLEPGFLPGQTMKINEMKKNAFVNGFVKAMSRMI